MMEPWRSDPARMELPCFHLSIPAEDLDATAAWYGRVLGCVPGRRSEAALILDLGGHQLVAQRCVEAPQQDQRGIYPRHFGLVLPSLSAWEQLRDAVAAAGESFAVEPKCRYPGGPLEHRSFFLRDPSGNWLEFKHYTHGEAVLGCREQAAVGDPDFR
ncbi:VOC family protein [Aphanothece microscopica]